MANPEQYQSLDEQLGAEYRRGYKSGHAAARKRITSGTPINDPVVGVSTEVSTSIILNVLERIHQELAKLSTVMEAYARANHL